MYAFTRRTLTLAALLALSFTGAAMAQTPAVTGLGQSWPNAPDVSASPHFHVYVFDRAGLRFVQVNDAAGTVRGAVVYSGGDIIGLPVGADAGRWVTPDEGVFTSALANGEQVFSDGTVKVKAAPQPDGTVQLLALPGECTNPAECSVKGP